MAAPYTDSEDGGIVRCLTVDGIDLDIGTGPLTVDPVPIATTVDTIDGGSVKFQPSMPGAPNVIERYTISFPIGDLRGPTRKALERIRARGGYHTVAVYKPESAFYVVSNTSWDLLLPKYRRNAAQTFAGLIYSGVTVGTDTFPLLAWQNGTPLTVSYVATPASLGTPGAGDIVVSAAPLASGQATDYVPMRVGGLTVGDVIEIEWFPAFICELVKATVTFPQTITESRAYQFRER